MQSDLPMFALGRVLSQETNEVSNTGDPIALTGVLNRGRGVLVRPKEEAASNSYPNLNRLKVGQVIYSKLKAFEGSVAVVTPDAHGSLASPEFPTFSVGSGTLPAYLALVFEHPQFWESLSAESKGMGGRRERLHPADFLNVLIPIPSVSYQRRIVDLLSSADRLVGALEHEVAAASLVRSELSAKLLSDVRNRIPIGSLLTERKDQLTIDDDTFYTQVTVSGAGRGMRLRERKHGRDIGTKKQTVLRQDELVVSRIDARKGAMSVVPPDFAGAIVTSGFPCFTIDQTKALAPYVDLVVRSAAFARACDGISAGTTNRVAADMKRFGGLEVPLPALDEQRRIVDLAATADSRLGTAQDRAHAAQTLRDQLLHDLLSGAHAIPESYDRFLAEVQA